MEEHCPRCGLELEGSLRCPLCDHSMVRVNLRRFLLWSLVVEEYLVVLVLLLRFTVVH